MKIEQKIKNCLSGINEQLLCYQTKKWEEFVQNEDPKSFDEEVLMMFERIFIQYQILCLYRKYEIFIGNNEVNLNEFNICLNWIVVLTKAIFISEIEFI